MSLKVSLPLSYLVQAFYFKIFKITKASNEIKIYSYSEF